LPETRRGHRGNAAMAWLGFFAVAFSLGSPVIHAREAREIGDRTEVWLVTYAPGEIYWQRFGHNAIWIRDSGLGLDHVFNFGFFDFEQESFFLRFLQGRLLYFSAAVPAEREFAQYIDENRSIRAQRLDMTPAQALSLADYLVNEVQPENRDYLYDYFWNNCSTRVRDALDAVLGSALKEAFDPYPAEQNMREITRRLTVADYWLYLGLELGMGASVDQPISRWYEFFIPGLLADGMAQLPDAPGSYDHGVVLEDVMLYTSTQPEPPSHPEQWWPQYLLLSAGLLALALALSRMVRLVQPLHLARLWLLVSGLLGIAVFYLGFMTDHDAAGNNLNLAVCNPLWILCWMGRKFLRSIAWLVLGCGALAVVMMLLPPHQYTADVLALVLPLNVVSALVLLRTGR